MPDRYGPGTHSWLITVTVVDPDGHRVHAGDLILPDDVKDAIIAPLRAMFPRVRTRTRATWLALEQSQPVLPLRPLNPQRPEHTSRR